MQRAPKASSKCQGKASTLMCTRLSLPAQHQLQAQGASSRILGLVGAKKPPKLGPLTVALKLCNRKKYRKFGSASLLATTF